MKRVFLTALFLLLAFGVSAQDDGGTPVEGPDWSTATSRMCPTAA